MVPSGPVAESLPMRRPPPRGLVGVAPGSEEERSRVRPKVEWTAETREVACARKRGEDVRR